MRAPKLLDGLVRAPGQLVRQVHALPLVQRPPASSVTVCAGFWHLGCRETDIFEDREDAASSGKKPAELKWIIVLDGKAHIVQQEYLHNEGAWLPPRQQE